GVAVNGSGDVWIAGETLSRDLATTAGALRPKFQGSHSVFGDGFVAKFSNGTNLSYLTYLGGGGQDAAFAIAVTAKGEALVTGYTDSGNFPITNAFQPRLGGTNLNARRVFLLDAFVTKLDTNGALVYSTYLGGDGRDVGLGIAVDSLDRAYVTGLTGSKNFPIVNPLQGTYGGAGNYSGASYHAAGDAFVARFSPDGSTLEYSTYLGGTNRENGQGIAVDSAFCAYVVGQTASTNFPTTNAISSTMNGTNHSLATDGFISKLSPDGRSLVYSTYLGGFQNDVAMAVAVDSSANAYVTGYTFSTNFPVTQSIFTAWSSRTNFNSDVFVTRLDPFGSTNGGYSVVFGGRNNDEGLGIAVDAAQNAYVVGITSSKTNFADLNVFATLPAGFSATNSSIRPYSINDGFVVQLDPSGNSLFSAYFGGSRNDQANAVAFDTTAGVAYIVGTTLSTNFPGTDPLTFHGTPPHHEAVFSRIQF
ncbi:MAG TPA: SBBP repeat-containing protein, partial [Verrucomicrobiae bacterium]|nr:SBBP repeat-containing protein [Verrucomicrobiae bacterium]